MQSKEAGSLRQQEAIIIRLSFHATVRLPAADLSKNLCHLSKLFPIYFSGNGIQNKYKHVRLLDIYFSTRFNLQMRAINSILSFDFQTSQSAAGGSGEGLVKLYF